MHDIVVCGQKMADAKVNANGVFIALNQISPDRTSFAVLMAFKTGGKPDWALTQFEVQPPDPEFNCGINGWEKASKAKRITLDAMTRAIGCSKSANKHVTLVVDTTEGGGISIQLDSRDEAITNLRQDMEAKIRGLSIQLNKAEGTIAAIAAARAEVISKLPQSADFYVKPIPLKPMYSDEQCNGSDVLISAACTNSNGGQTAVGPKYFDRNGTRWASCRDTLVGRALRGN